MPRLVEARGVEVLNSERAKASGEREDLAKDMDEKETELDFTSKVGGYLNCTVCGKEM